MASPIGTAAAVGAGALGVLVAGYALRIAVRRLGAPPAIQEPEWQFYVPSNMDLVDELLRVKHKVFGRTPYSRKQLFADVEKAAGCTVSERDRELFAPGIDAILEYLNHEKITPTGAAMLYSSVRDGLSRRAKVLAAVEADAELGEDTDIPLVFIIGLPRTGSTLTQRLMACHPQARALPLWKMVDLDPETEGDEQKAKKKLSWMLTAMYYMFGKELFDKVQQVHPIGDGSMPEEDQGLLQASLIHEEFLMHKNYREWMLAHDASSAYDVHGMLLNVIARKFPDDKGYWLLKAPIHTFFLDSLIARYPNARFVWTHRDPKKAMGSSCSMRALFRAMEKPSDKRDYSERFLLSDQESLKRAWEVRQREGEDKFCDIYFQDLMENPQDALVRVQEQLFGKCEEEEEYRERMTEWLEEDAKDKPARHKYNLDDYGVSGDEVDSAFSWYYTIFNKRRM